MTSYLRGSPIEDELEKREIISSAQDQAFEKERRKKKRKRLFTSLAAPQFAVPCPDFFIGIAM